MANKLCSDIIAGFRRTYPQVSATVDGLTLYQEALLEVLALLQIEEGSEDFNLTDGTREYEKVYNPDLFSIRAAYYITDASTAVKLKAVDTDWMDENISVWRYTTDTGTPDKFYVGSPTSAALTTQGKIVLGLDPIPDTTTTGGYPIVRIYGPEYEEPAVTSDVPQSITHPRVLIECMKKNYASDRDSTENWQRFRDAFGYELAQCRDIISGQVEDLLDQSVPTWMKNSILP